MPNRRSTTPRARAATLACGAAAAVAGGILVPVAWSARTAATNSVSASIAYTDGSKSKVPVWKDITITITRNAGVVVDKRLLPEDARDSVFTAPKLLAVDLDDDGDAEVIVDVFTGGADCCRRSVIFHREGDSYADEIVDWSDTSYRLADVLGKSSPEFLASDSRFPKAWDSDARGPLQIFAFRDGALRDVSRRVPRQLRRDARIHLKAWRAMRRKKAGDARPVVAAYVADLVRLGKVSEAREAVRSAARAHELHASAGNFERLLDRKLISWGYAAHRVLSR